MGRVYLGVDVGTTSTKCLAVGEGGEVLALAQHPYSLTHPRQGWAEQDPEDYWHALVAVVNRCVGECECGADVRALAMSTQGGTLIVTDESGTPLAPAMSWMDNRAEAEHRALLAEAGSSFWYRKTGQPLTPLSSPCKIRWLARTAPDVMEKSPRICFVPDFLARRLCGEFVMDVPSASWTSLLSPVERGWSSDALSLVGVAAEHVSRPIESGAVIGELLPDTADQLGVGRGAKLVAGAFDQSAAAHGAGAMAGGRSVLSCGTAWVLYSVASSPVSDEKECLCVCCHVSPEEWCLVLPFPGGAVYDWLAQTLGTCTGGTESQSGPAVFIPHLYGGLSPDWRGESKGSLLGLTLSHSLEDIRVALMRGVAFEARRNLEAAEALCGRIQSVRMVGGAGKSETWPQMVANVLDRPVEVSDFVESACYGAAKLAAGEDGARWRVTGSPEEFVPVPANVETEEAEYGRYLRFYEALLPLYGADFDAKEGAET